MSGSNGLSRRDFLKKSSVALGAAMVPAIVPSSVLGQNAPSNKIVMGCIGVGGQGTANLNAFLNDSEVKIIAVSDTFKSRMDHASGLVNNKYGTKDCSTYGDFRELLDVKDIDAVTCCTPDHWHGLVTIAAAKAGKDIYCEKPLTNTIAEAYAVEKAVTRYGRVLQTGSHERSRRNARYACQVVRNGRIGKLKEMIINLPCIDQHHFQVMNDKDKHETLPVPDDLNYDMWMGPTPVQPYTPARVTMLWRFVMLYGGGEMSDRGAHVIDLAQLGNGSDDTTPIEFKGTGEVPKSTLFDTFFNMKFEATYANGVKMIGSTDEPRGVKFVGEDGWIFIHVHGGHLEASSDELLKQKFTPNEIDLGISPGHHRDFLNCVKSRQKPMAPVQVGCNTAVTCHLLNISMLLGGRKLKWDPKKREVIGDPEANALLSRPMRGPWHL